MQQLVWKVISIDFRPNLVNKKQESNKIQILMPSVLFLTQLSAQPFFHLLVFKRMTFDRISHVGTQQDSD